MVRNLVYLIVILTFSAGLSCSRNNEPRSVSLEKKEASTARLTTAANQNQRGGGGGVCFMQIS